MAGFFFTGEQDLTPEGLDRKRVLLNALRKDNLSTAPVGHWTQALARVVGSTADTLEEGQLNRTEKAGTEKAKAELMKVLGIGGAVSPGEPTAAAGVPPSSPAAATPATPKSTLPIMAQQDPSAALIRSFEGYRDKPYWDVNAHRVGYGSDTITNPDGSVQKVQPGMQINRQQAELDLQRRISTEFQPRAASAVGENWAKLPPQAQAALTSITYNYGSLPKSVAAAAQSGDPNAIAQAVEGLAGHNGGINANRRMQEAALIRGADMPSQGAQTAEQTLARPAAGQFAIPTQAAQPNAQALMAALSNPWAARSPALMQLAASVAGKQLSRDPVEDMKNRLQLQQMMRDADMPKTITVKRNGEDFTGVWNPATRTIDAPSFSGDANSQPKISREIEQRRSEALKMGLDPNEGRTKQYILTGQYPKDPELTATDKNAILEADQMVSDNKRAILGLQKAKTLSKDALGFPGASAVATVGSLIGNESSRKTQELNQVVTEQALGSLKAIFGGNPTEGERKILLEIQGSASLSDPVRQKIFDRAIEAANARLQFNEERARQLRGGSFYKPPQQQGPQGQPAAPGKSDPLGIR